MLTAKEAREEAVKNKNKYIKKAIKNINLEIKRNSKAGYRKTNWYFSRYLSENEQAKITSYYTSLGYNIDWTDSDFMFINWEEN